MDAKQIETKQKIIDDFCDKVYFDISKRLSYFLSHGLLNVTDDVQDPSLFYKAAKNQRDIRKNRYLINKTLIDDLVKVEKIKYTPYELVWGKEKDRKLLVKQLFNSGIHFLLLNLHDHPEVTEALASDYAFAIDQSALEFDYFEKDSGQEEKSKVLDESILHLYKLLRPTFEELHKKYFSKKYIQKLDLHFQKFCSNYLTELMKQFNQQTEIYEASSICELASLVNRIVLNDDLEKVLNLKPVKVNNSEGKNVTNEGPHRLAFMETSDNTRQVGRMFLSSIVKDQKKMESEDGFFKQESYKLKTKLGEFIENIYD